MSVNRDFKPAHNWGKHKQRDHLTTLVVVGLIVFALLTGVAINLHDMVVDVDEDAADLALETSPPSDAPPPQQYDDALLPFATPEGTAGASASADDDSPMAFFSFYEELPTRQVRISEYRKPPSKSAKNTLLLPPPPPQTAAKPEVKPPQALTPKPPADDRGGYIIQAGAFNQFAQADRVRGRLANLGFKAYVQAVNNGDARVHRVRIGPIGGAAQAQAIRRQLDSKGIKSITLGPN